MDSSTGMLDQHSRATPRVDLFERKALVTVRGDGVALLAVIRTPSGIQKEGLFLLRQIVVNVHKPRVDGRE